MKFIVTNFCSSLVTFYKQHTNMRGDGNLYVLFVLISVMVGAFALTGGLLPSFDKDVTNYEVVEVDMTKTLDIHDPKSTLQLVSFNYITTPTMSPNPSVSPPPTNICTAGKLAILLIVDKSGSIAIIKDTVKTSLESFKNKMLQSSGDNLFSMVSFASTASLDIPLDRVSVNGNLLGQRIDSFVTGGGTYYPPTFRLQRDFLTDTTNNYPDYKRVIIVLSDGKFTWVAGDIQEAQAEFIRSAGAIKNSANTDVYFLWITQIDISTVSINAVTDSPKDNYLVPVTTNASNLSAKLDEIFADACK